MVRSGIEPRASDLQVSCPADCTILPGSNLVHAIERLYVSAISAVHMDGSIGEWFRTTMGASLTHPLQHFSRKDYV